jgi:phage FluMu protein Com
MLSCAFSFFNDVNSSSMVNILISLNAPRESRWLSPDTMQSAFPSKAMQTYLRMKCGKCGCWNRFLIEKRAVEAPTSEAKAKFLIRAYEP